MSSWFSVPKPCRPPAAISLIMSCTISSLLGFINGHGLLFPLDSSWTRCSTCRLYTAVSMSTTTTQGWAQNSLDKPCEYSTGLSRLNATFIGRDSLYSLYYSTISIWTVDAALQYLAGNQSNKVKIYMKLRFRYAVPLSCEFFFFKEKKKTITKRKRKKKKRAFQLSCSKNSWYTQKRKDNHCPHHPLSRVLMS